MNLSLIFSSFSSRLCLSEHSSGESDLSVIRFSITCLKKSTKRVELSVHFQSLSRRIESYKDWLLMKNRPKIVILSKVTKKFTKKKLDKNAGWYGSIHRIPVIPVTKQREKTHVGTLIDDRSVRAVSDNNEVMKLVHISKTPTKYSRK